MLPMKLKSFNYLLGLLIFFLCSPLSSEEKIDIWKNKKEVVIDTSKKEDDDIKVKTKLQTSQTIKALEKIEIEEGSKIQSEDQTVFGIYEPADYDFNLNMW